MMVSGKKIIAGVAVAAATTGLAALASTKIKTHGVVYHVAADGEEWTVKAEGAKRAVSRHGTKKDAVGAARELANASRPSRLVIHKLDGEVQRTHEYQPV